jgi:hypothetical protein
MHRTSAALVALSMLALSAQPLTAGDFAPEQVQAGSSLFSRNCAIMPAWSGVLKPAEVEALWAYVCEGEK